MIIALLLSVSLAVSGTPWAQTAAPVYRPAADVSVPVVIHEVRPDFPADAAGIDGAVTLEGVVEIDGSVTGVRVVRSAEPALDTAAAEALKQWRFRPGLKDGQAVRVLIEVVMTFARGENLPRLDSTDVFKPGPGVTAPVVTRDVKPSYPRAAMDARIQGRVTLDCVVRPDGRVGDTRVSTRLDPDLDLEAVRALKQWRFTPGERQGKPVPVQVSVEMSFALK